MLMECKRHFRFKALLSLLTAWLCVPPLTAGATEVPLSVNENGPQVNNILITANDDGSFTLITTGGDPYLSFTALETDLPADATMLTFEYKVDNNTGNDFEIFFSPIMAGHSINKGGQPASNDWVTAYFDVTAARCDWGWGKKGDFLRFDPASGAGITMQVRNIRVCTQEEALPKDLEKEDGMLLINSQDDFDQFTTLVNNGFTTLSAKFNTDIAVRGTTSLMNTYSGVMDGNGHTLNYDFDHTTEGASFIRNLYGTIKNFRLEGNIRAVHRGYGGLSSWSYGAHIENIDNNLQIESTYEGDNTGGGFVAWSNLSSTPTVIKNCVFRGSIKSDVGVQVAGFVGWSANFATEIDNSLFIGDLDVVITDGDAYGTNAFSRGDGNGTNTPTINCYYLTNPQYVNESCKQITKEQLASGEACFLLNGNQQAIGWWQTIGTDAVPNPLKGDSKQVYGSGDIACDGTITGSATFSNTGSTSLTGHSYVDGICENCGHLQEDYIPVEDGWYTVSTDKQLSYISKFVNAAPTNRNINVRLTADIDMSGIDGFMPLNYYSGIFDGQGHTISGLNISLPETDCVGIIGIAMPGCTLKNLTLAEDCQIEGKAFVGMIGESYPTAGTITMANLVNRGRVVGNAQNAGGIVGCCMEGTAVFDIRNCAVTGSVKGDRESAAISGWVGNNSKVVNCWSIATVEGADDEASKFVRPKEAVLTNCYSTIGTQGNIIDPESVGNGELTWKLNGQSFVNTAWYQTIEADLTPVSDNTHGVVYKTYDGTYGSVQDEASYKVFVAAYTAGLEQEAESAIANKQVMEEMNEAVQGLKTQPSFEAFLEAYAEFADIRKQADASIAAYKAYMDKVESVRLWLESNEDIICEERDLLEDYIYETVAPNEDMPNGSYNYIIAAENSLLNNEEIAAEAEYVNQMMLDAIRYGFSEGADVTNLLVNPNFESGTDGWKGVLASGTIVTEGIGACESWSTTSMDMYQTITGLKDGVYELTVNGGFRPFNDRNSYQYSAMIYANGNYNYLSSVRETIVPAEEAVDHENCFLTANDADGANDLEVTDEEGNLLGYAIHGRSSVIYAAKGGRAVNRVLVNVTDGNLTVGVKNPHYYTTDNEWTGIGNIKLTYLGNLETSEPDLSNTLASMTERANTILTLYEFQYDDRYPQYPNFSQELRDRLTAIMKRADAATTTAEQYACIEELSAAFLEIHECKTAYRDLVTEAEVYMDVAAKAAEAGMMETTEAEKIYALQEEVFNGYIEGIYSTQEAKDMAMLKATGLAPEADENGYLHITDQAKFYYFVSKVNSGQNTLNAILETDIMNFTEGNIIYNYKGHFDGNRHSIDVNITRTADNAAIFDDLAAGSSAKDLHVTGVINTNSKYAAGLAAHTHNNAIISGIHSSVIINSSIEGDGTHAGIVAVVEEATTIKNCLFDGQMLGSATTCCGGIVGWSSGSATIDGCLIIADMQVSADGGNIVTRNPGNAVVSNCLYVTPYGEIPTGASQFDPELLPTGEITWKLNGGHTANVGWYQNLGEDDMPVLDPTHKTVYRTADGTYTNEPQSELDKHNGTQDDPFIISTVEELAILRNYMNTGGYTYVKLAADIDMSGVETWVPLNMDADKANGKGWMNWIDFDGQGHVIHNFSCTTGTQDYNSFFGILCGNVRNVGFENANVSSIKTGAGILGGYIGHDNFSIDGVKQTSTIENVWVSGKLSVIQGYAGGMVGNVGGPTIFHNCYANVDITTELQYAGGIIGRVRDAVTLENVYAAGTNSKEIGIVGGGKQDATAPSIYRNVVVWCNTSALFGPTTEDDTLEGISYYDGTNFSELQQTVVSWGSPWTCDMQEGSYPTLNGTGDAIESVGADKPQDGRIYNINGIRISQPTKGIFIINGKKVAVK